MIDVEPLKQKAAAAAEQYVENGMVVGLGSGSTFQYALGTPEEPGWLTKYQIKGVPTSFETAMQATEVGIPLIQKGEWSAVDVLIDGADQIDPHYNVIKGGGGYHTREKVVAQAAKKVVLIVDHTKMVDTLDVYPIPVEVNPFAYGSVEV